MTSERIDLEERAASMLGELIDEQDTFDAAALEDAIQERAHEEADNCVIYHHWADQIIQDYERHVAAPNESELGGEYRADQHQEASRAWAYEIACAVLNSEAAEALEGVKEDADTLCDAIANQDDDQAPDPSELRVSLSCPHGWAAHDKEDDDGTHYWISGQIDGCHALAIDAGPFWLSYTWTPEPKDADSDV